MISTDDRLAILDLLAQYCWRVDAGDRDGWAALWTEDGVFSGLPVSFQGRDQLRKVPSGKFRHILANIAIEGGPGGDEASAKAYSTIYEAASGRLASLGFANYRLIRAGRAWRIKALEVAFSPVSPS